METVPTTTEITAERHAGADGEWGDRAARLFREFERPAKAMVRRAFRTAFGPDELDDIYSAAWLGTWRALAGRQANLADDEVRRYVLTAVANQASKELRRRRRKPTASLDLAGAVADQHAETPDERAASAERARVARDVLGSLPPRRRAVVLMRYGWGLEPNQICGLVSGLSPRAYRKEVTRGVDQFSRGLAAVESGEWCAEREPLLRALASGNADDEQSRQARAHLAHCRPCAGYVTRLGEHLHELGGAAIALGAIEGLSGGGRLAAILDRLSQLPAILGPAPADAASAATAMRGAGAAGAGALAKLACLGGGVAATVCIATGTIPLSEDGGRASPAPVSEHRPPRARVESPAAQPARLAPSPQPVISPAGDVDRARARRVPAAAASKPARERVNSAQPAPEFGVEAIQAPPPVVRPAAGAPRNQPESEWEWEPAGGRPGAEAVGEFGP